MCVSDFRLKLFTADICHKVKRLGQHLPKEDSDDCDSLVSIVTTQSELDCRFIDDSEDGSVGEKVDEDDLQ